MIRKLFAVSILFAFILSSCLNDASVPSLVKKRFKELYPDTKEVKWLEKENSKFVATFKLDGKDMIASFSKYGIWQETKNMILATDIPPISAGYVKQFYPKAIIAQNYAVKNADGDFFELDVKKDSSSFSVLFDKDGKLFKDDNNVLLKNFKKMYPNPSDVEWKRAKDGKFDVFFKDQGKACKVSFAMDGKWIETETLASETEVPEIAFAYIKKNFKAYEIKGIIFVKTTDTELFNFVVQLKEKDFNLYFDLEGNFIKKEDLTK